MPLFKVDSIILANIMNNLHNRFPIEYQQDSQSCGPVSLMMIAKYFGYNYSLELLSHLCGLTHEGVSLANLVAGAESIGLHSLSIRCSISDVSSRTKRRVLRLG